MSRSTWSIALAAALTLGAAACMEREEMDQGMGQAGAEMGRMGAGVVEYTVVFKNLWTPATHPVEYPSANAITGPHFSGLIGATHAAGFSLFAEGAAPSAGLEKLSEEGKHSPLDEEIRAALASGAAGMLVTTGPLRDLADSLVTTIRVDSAHPMVSLVAMIAPSPDWFAGARDVNLMENGAWVASRTVPVLPYDAGSDHGTTYKAADRDAQPKSTTALNMSRHFVTDGVTRPVATITFRMKP